MICPHCEEYDVDNPSTNYGGLCENCEEYHVPEEDECGECGECDDDS